MANYNLTAQTISSSFQQLMQYDRDTGSLYDGTGSLITDLDITASVATSASHALNADNAISASHSIISDNAIEIFVNVKNTSGFDIPKGYAVHSTGVTGDKINITTASYDDPNLMPAIGITQEAISNNAVGEVILTGRIIGINTADLTEGSTVYVNGDGSLTDTRPTGSALIQNIGTCVKVNATEGEILVLGAGRSNDIPNIQNGYAWVGDVNGVPQAVSTASWDSHTDITSLNQFTASQETINSGYNSFTASYYTDSSSFDSRIDDIVASGSGADWDVNLINIPAGLVSGSSQLTASYDTRYALSGSLGLPDGVISGSAQISDLGYAITGSNTFTGGQTISAGNLEMSGTGQQITNTNGAIVGSTIEGQTEMASPLLLIDTIEPNNGTQVAVNTSLNVSGNITGSAAKLSGNLDMSGVGQVLLINNGTVEANEVATSNLLVDSVEPNNGTNIRINGDTQISASATTSRALNVWDKGYTDGGQPFPIFSVYSSQERTVGGVAAEVAGGAFFAPSLQAEPVDSSTTPLLVTDAVQPRITVKSQDDASASGINVQINGVTDIAGSELFVTTTAATIEASTTFSSSIDSALQSISIIANTASVDFSSPQMQVLALPGGGSYRLQATNVSDGQVVNVLIKTSGTATLTLDSSIKEPINSQYTATTGVGRDILTFSSFDYSTTGETYLVNVQNLA